MANKKLKDITFHLVGDTQSTEKFKDALGTWSIPCTNITQGETPAAADVCILITDDANAVAPFAQKMEAGKRPYAIATRAVMGVKKALRPLAANPQAIVDKANPQEGLANLICHLSIPAEEEEPKAA